MKRLLLAGGVAAMLFTTGCVIKEFKTEMEGIRDERVTHVDSKFFSLKILEVTSQINNEGDLSVAASVEVSRPGFFTYTVCGNPQVKIFYAFEWLDAKGNATDKVWKEFRTLPGSIITFSGVAPATKYVNFRLYVAAGENPDNAVIAAESGAKAPAGKKVCPKKAAVSKAPVKKAAVKKAPVKKAAVRKAAVPSNSSTAKTKDGKLAEPLK